MTKRLIVTADDAAMLGVDETNEPPLMWKPPDCRTLFVRPFAREIEATRSSSPFARASASCFFTSAEIFGVTRSSYVYAPSGSTRFGPSCVRSDGFLPAANAFSKRNPSGPFTVSVTRSFSALIDHSTCEPPALILPTFSSPA